MKQNNKNKREVEYKPEHKNDYEYDNETTMYDVAFYELLKKSSKTTQKDEALNKKYFGGR